MLDEIQGETRNNPGPITVKELSLRLNVEEGAGGHAGIPGEEGAAFDLTPGRLRRARAGIV